MIQSVGRAARILKALGSESARLGVTELAERLGLAKATVHGLLRTLEAHQFVQQDLETGKYRLGPALLQLGNAFLDNHELRARSLLWAESLAARSGEAVHVGVLYGPSVLIVHHVFRPDNSVQILEVGASIPWHACALGKAMVAYLEPPRRAELLAGPLPRLTGRTLTAPAALDAELERVAAAGVAVEAQEAIVGEAGVAAALFDNRGAVVGAIGLAGPVEHLLPGGRPAAAAAAAVLRAPWIGDLGAGGRWDAGGTQDTKRQSRKDVPHLSSLLQMVERSPANHERQRRNAPRCCARIVGQQVSGFIAAMARRRRRRARPAVGRPCIPALRSPARASDPA